MHFVNAKGILTGGKGHFGMNIYRGCSHGCIYCDSRSKCYQFTHPFEDIEVKQNAPELLEQALKSKRQKAMIGTGSMSDPYMHCEEKLGLTRKCLEIICRYGFGAAVQTKSDRILRDIDLLEEINRKAKCVVQMTLTTWDDRLCGILEPNVCNTKRRVEVLEEMRKRGIPTVVWLTPILPFINDTKENVTAILEAYNMCQLQPDPGFADDNNYLKNTVAEEAHLDFFGELPEEKAILADGTDVTETVKKAESWLIEHSF